MVMTQFVKDFTPGGLLLESRYNRRMKTPNDILRESHKELGKSEGEWVAKASQACSVMSTLVLSAAFATRTSVPGGDNNDKGYAILGNNAVFKSFRSSSFAAFFCALISTICLLSIVASPSQSIDSWRYVPVKLNFGISFMFASIICLWISFCAADFVILDDATQKLHKPLPTYIFLSLVIILLLATLLPTFLSPIWSTIVGIPTYRLIINKWEGIEKYLGWSFELGADENIELVRTAKVQIRVVQQSTTQEKKRKKERVKIFND